MKNEETNALVVAENNLTVTDKINESIKRCTLDLNNEDNAVSLYNVLTGDDDALLNDMIDQTIVMTGAFMDKHPAPVVDEGTGEVIGTTSKYRIIIFDEEGKTYATGSYGVYNSVRKMLDLLGVSLISKGIKVEVIKVPTQDGKQKLSLKLVK